MPRSSWKTQFWLSGNVCDYITPNIWLLDSLNWNPLDYYVEDKFKQETIKTPK